MYAVMNMLAIACNPIWFVREDSVPAISKGEESQTGDKWSFSTRSVRVVLVCVSYKTTEVSHQAFILQRFTAQNGDMLITEDTSELQLILMIFQNLQIVGKSGIRRPKRNKQL